MTVPFDENPYSAMAAYFKTDEGVEVFQICREKLRLTCNNIYRLRYVVGYIIIKKQNNGYKRRFSL